MVSDQIAVAFQAGNIKIQPKTFSTGSRGYNGAGKVMIDGKKYQFSGNFVEIGSKPSA